MRGKLRLNPHRIHNTRITPACAGKTSRTRRAEVQAEDHPRVCGENDVVCVPYVYTRGSPPRVRGKPVVDRGLISGSRITPACAGKTLVAENRLAASEDHPRVCGENLLGSDSLPWRSGSPPRVRGKRRRAAFRLDKSRITPACAGKTWAGLYRYDCGQDHPRVCGENRYPHRCIASE